MCLHVDDADHVTGQRHATTTLSAPSESVLLGGVGPVFGFLEHRLTLAVFVHGDGDHFLGFDELTLQCLHADHENVALFLGGGGTWAY